MAAIFLQPYKSVFGETIAEIIERGCVTGVAVSRKLIFGGRAGMMRGNGLTKFLRSLHYLASRCKGLSI